MNRAALSDAGFSNDQIEALFEVFASRHHMHEIDDIEGLEEELIDLQPEDADEE